MADIALAVHALLNEDESDAHSLVCFTEAWIYDLPRLIMDDTPSICLYMLHCILCVANGPMLGLTCNQKDTANKW